MSSKKTLIVEDFCDRRELLGTVLAAWGWIPILAESGRGATSFGAGRDDFISKYSAIAALETGLANLASVARQSPMMATGLLNCHLIANEDSTALDRACVRACKFFLKLFTIRQYGFPSRRKYYGSGSIFIITMGSAWLGGNMSTSRKILIVEECGELRDLLGEALALLGWEPILAESDGEVLDKLKGETPSLILLNMPTPVMKGIKLAASLKAHPGYKTIPILAASGNSRGLTRERCLALGCDDFIAKPFALPELEMRLTNILAEERRKKITATDPMNSKSNRRERRSKDKDVDRRRVA